MGRPPKLSKWSIENALSRWRTVSEAARQLGLDRRTFQRSMKRYEVDKAAVLTPFAAPKESAFAPLPEIPKRDPESAAAPAKPERNIQCLTAADFTGPNRGEAGGSGSGAPRSPDELLSRYRKLRGK